MLLTGINSGKSSISKTETNGSRFESIGIKLPEKQLSSKELMSSLKHKVNVDFERLTGINSRKVCSQGEDSYTLAVDAARDCLRHSKYEAKDIEMLISCSITRYKNGHTSVYEPPISLYIKDSIGASGALNFDISNACAGMLTGVFIMENFIRRGVIRRGMVVSGEYTTHLSENAARSVRTIASRQFASLTVGDAGAAAILERTGDGQTGMVVSHFTTLAKYNKLCIGKPSKRNPGATMKTKARKIHRVAISDSPPILMEALKNSGLDYNDIDFVVPHQTSERAILSGAKRLSSHFGAKPKNIVINLAEYGNTASTTHFITMYRYLREGKFKKGDNIMLMCFASGLVVGVIIFTMDDMVEHYGSDN